MKSLSWPMIREITKDIRRPPARHVTLKALFERELIDRPSHNWSLTKKGESYLSFDYDLENKQCYKEGVRVLSCADELSKLCLDEEVDVYVYRSAFPWVVKNGDGQNPLYVLHPKLFWELRAGLVKDFYRTSIIGHKGSYGFKKRNRGKNDS